MSTKFSHIPRIVIVGAGFAGLRAARAFARAGVRVTLLDRNNFHLFQPLLYQVATAALAPDEIAQPVRAILGQQTNLEFRIAEVRKVDLDRRALDTERGQIPYDYLILAAGGTTNTFGLLPQNGGQPATPLGLFGLKTLEDAEAIHNHLLSMCELALEERDPSRRAALLTFAVAGGGPSGVESAGAVAELVGHILPRDYPQLERGEARVILLEAGRRLLPAMPESLARSTARVLQRKGVEVRYGTTVEAYAGQAIHLKGGETLPARTLIWAAGIKAVPLYDRLALEKGSLGRVCVEPTLQVSGHAEVFIAGDGAFLVGTDGKPLPMVAPVAMQQGELAAKNILRLLAGKQPRAFHYHDPGMLATIGRSQAVAQIGPLRLSGLLAWLTWVVVHIYQLVGFRNRLLVMVDWAWNYLAYDRPVRRLARSAWEREHKPATD